VVDNNEVVYDRKDQEIVTHLPDTLERQVVLTFDDGPGRHLPEILDVLRAEDVPAVFFWQTRLLYPERPWERVLAEGHMIGTHTIKHPDLRRLDYDEQYKELSISKEKIERVTGQAVRYFRPPFGQYDTCTLSACRELSLTPVMWSIGSFDWSLKGDPARIVSNVVSHLAPGAIVLLHELPQTLQVLPELIRSIRAAGYGFALLPR
jgi:peptidoglycan/xylan/chitin deacetylase (PgdA/CDA1 family)